MGKSLQTIAKLHKFSEDAIEYALTIPDAQESEWAKLTKKELEIALVTKTLPAKAAPATAAPTTAATPAPAHAAPPTHAQPAVTAAPAAAATPTGGGARTATTSWFTPPQVNLGGMNLGPLIYTLVVITVLVGGWMILSYAAPNLPGWFSLAVNNFGKGNLGKVAVLGLRQPNGLRSFGDAQIVLLMVTALYALGRIFEALLRKQVITDALGIFAAALIPTLAFAGESMSFQLSIGQFKFQSAESGPVLIVCLLWTLFWVYRGQFDLTPLTGWLGDSAFIALTVGALGAFSKLLGLSGWGYVLPFMQSVETIRAGNTAIGLFSLEVLGLIFAAVFVQSMELFSRRDINSMLASWASVAFYFLCRWGFSLNMFVSIGLSAVFLVAALMYVATLIPPAKEAGQAMAWRAPIYAFSRRLYIPDPSDLIIYVALLWVLVVMLTGMA